MYTKAISAILFLGVTTALLTSCSQDSSVGQPSSDTPTYERNQPMNGSGTYRGRTRSGSGGMMRSGSGGMMQKLSPEDQAIFVQIRAARQSGDTTLVDKLTQQLKQKNPNLRFGNGAKASGSGTVGNGTNN